MSNTIQSIYIKVKALEESASQSFRSIRKVPRRRIYRGGTEPKGRTQRREEEHESPGKPEVIPGPSQSISQILTNPSPDFNESGNFTYG